MADRGLPVGEPNLEKPYEALDRAIKAARRLAEEPFLDRFSGAGHSAQNELAYLLQTQIDEEALSASLGTQQFEDLTIQRAFSAVHDPLPPDTSEKPKLEADCSPEGIMREPDSAPWLQLIKPAIVTTHTGAAAALALAWMSGLLSEPLSAFNRTSSIQARTPYGGPIITEAENPILRLQEYRSKLTTNSLAAQPGSPPSVALPETAFSLALVDGRSRTTTVDHSLAKQRINSDPRPVGNYSPTEALEVRSESAAPLAGGKPTHTGHSPSIVQATKSGPISRDDTSRRIAAGHTEEVVPDVAGRSRLQESLSLKTPEAQPSLGAGVKARVEDDSTNALIHDGRMLSPSHNVAKRTSSTTQSNSMVSLEASPPDWQTGPEWQRANEITLALKAAREALSILRYRTPVLESPSANRSISAAESLDAAAPRGSNSWNPPNSVDIEPLTDGSTAANGQDGKSIPPLHSLQIPTPSSTNSADEQRLIKGAEALIRIRAIRGARLLLERAGQLGSTRGLYLLAQTYDPIVLNQWQVLGIVSDSAKAQKLYGLSGMSQLRGENGIPESR